MRVSVVTNDKYLFRIFEIMLSDKAVCVMGFDPNATIIVHDCDCDENTVESNSAKVFRISKNPDADAIKIPLAHSFFDSILSKASNAPAISLSNDGKHAIIRGKSIKLTAHEYSLLSLLISGGENYTSRTEIANKVWNGASDSLVNVYIHYLREKLETDGEKVILSSRKYGYKLNPIYIIPSNRTQEQTNEKGELL